MFERVDCIVLAGGEGKRLRSVVSDVPKPMAEIDGKSFLDILLEQLDRSGCVGRAVLAVGYKAEKILARYGQSNPYDFEILFSVEDRLLGTGGAIKKALEYTRSGDVLVLNGDSFTDIDLRDMLGTHRGSGAKLTIALAEIQDVGRYGRVRIGEESQIVSFEEKKGESKPGLINAGIYLMKREVFDEVEVEKEISIETGLFPMFVEDLGRDFRGYVTRGRFIDIGVPETYAVAGAYLGGSVG